MLFLTFGSLLGWSVRADPGDLAKTVPGDVLAAYLVDVPPSDPQAPKPSSTLDSATVIIDQAFRLGLLNSLDIALRGWLDAIASLSTIVAHPHAVMLFDLQVRREDDDSHRVSSLSAAIVLRTRGENRLLERRIQHLLDSYTNKSESVLDTLEVSGHKVHRLRDQRLADWCQFSWGAIEDSFFVAIGEGSPEKVIGVLKAPSGSLGSDPSFRSGVETLAAQNALVTVHIAFEEVRRRSKLLGHKLDRMQAALTMQGAQRGLWAAGYAGKSFEIRQWLLTDRGEQTAVIAGQQFLNADRSQVVPAEARSFAAIGVEPSVWFERFCNAYLAARSLRNAAESRFYWRSVEQSAGLRFAELFGRLTGPIIVHDFPEHALRLPPAWTIVAPIREHAGAVREQVDAILTHWQRELEGAALRLAKTDDGIWFLHVGLEGPAVTVTDRHLLISFSPQAVRQNREFLMKIKEEGGAGR